MTPNVLGKPEPECKYHFDCGFDALDSCALRVLRDPEEPGLEKHA